MTPVLYVSQMLNKRLRVVSATSMEFPAGTQCQPNGVSEEKIILICSGALRYWLGDRELLLRTGAMLFRPTMSVAHWRVVAGGPCKFMYCEFTTEQPATPMLRTPMVIESCQLDVEQAAMERVARLVPQVDEAARLEAEGEIKAIVSRFFRRSVDPLADAKLVRAHQLAPAAEEAVQRAMHWLGQNYHQPDVLNDLAGRVGMNADYFRVVFRRRTGLTAQQFLKTLRMQAAISLLRMSHMSVKATAKAVGYTDPLFFSRAYRKYCGRPPTADRLPSAIQ